MSAPRSELDHETQQRLDGLRDWVWSSVSSDPPLDPYDPGTVLSVIDALLRDGIGPEETFKLQALGAVLGDALAVALDLSWVVVEDRLGRDPALRFGAVGDELFPVTMIFKRIEAGEPVRARELFAAAARSIAELSGE